ncbi:MAG: CoA transferase [Betaproteobacteria bacterium]|nr:CoA transferase [Betaproteobacteria bacterium]
MIAGPYCTRMLADLGAEVIKLEPPEGDYLRGRPPMKDGQSLYFGALNCGKQSIAIDLKHPRGAALVKELAARSEVLVENFRPGVMARLGFDWAALSAVNPGLVYCSISGYGQSGANAELPAYAPVVQAACGYDLANLGYQPHAERPLNTGIFTADYLGGVHAFGAISAALVKRANTGQGTRIDCALMDAMLGMLAYEVAEAQAPAEALRPLYQATRASDGFFIVAPITQANFEALARATGRPGWLADPRYASPAARAVAQNWEALLHELDVWAAGKTVAECESRMSSCGVPFGRYQSVGEVMASPYAAERGLFATVQAGAAEFRTPKPPFRMEGIEVGGRVPALGEHGASVLGRVLGYESVAIERLVAEGILR